MKRICLLLILCVCCNKGFSNSFTSLWTSAGLTKSKDDGLSFSHGFTYYKGVAYGVGVGLTGFYQQIGRNYETQINNSVGASMHFKASYAFVAPMFVTHLTKKGQVQAYVNAGVGYKVSGYDSVHKWSKVSWGTPEGKYDSMIDASKDLKSLIYRIGFGFTEYYYLRGKIRLSITEDFGIFPLALSKSNNSYHNDGVANIMHQFYKPTYFSITVGLTFRTSAEGDRQSGKRRMTK